VDKTVTVGFKCPNCDEVNYLGIRIVNADLNDEDIVKSTRVSDSELICQYCGAKIPRSQLRLAVFPVKA
jgi:hypothetical protein